MQLPVSGLWLTGAELKLIIIMINVINISLTLLQKSFLA
jgi:hypothetical protein